MKPENKPKIKQKSWLRTNFGKLLIAGALVAGGTGIGIYENVKSHEPIPIPATFDPSALKSVIGANNSVQMTFDEYSAVAPPIWEEQGEVMTIPVPIVFRDGRNPTLKITKMQNQIIDSLNIIDIQGLEQGDTILSLVDGEIDIFQGSEDLMGFFIDFKDSQGKDKTFCFALNCPLESLISFDHPIKDVIHLPIKKGQPIGKVLPLDKNQTGELNITGDGSLNEIFNLATTSDGKAILLK
jgi:hypothetical protein